MNCNSKYQADREIQALTKICVSTFIKNHPDRKSFLLKFKFVKRVYHGGMIDTLLLQANDLSFAIPRNHLVWNFQIDQFGCLQYEHQYQIDQRMIAEQAAMIQRLKAESEMRACLPFANISFNTVD